MLCVLIVGYFASIGWVAEKLNADLGRAYKATPTVDDHAHRAD